MLTKQTILTRTGPGIKCPVLYFQGKTNWKANLLEIYMLRNKDLRVLLGKQRIRDIRKPNLRVTNQQTNRSGHRKSQQAKGSHKDESVGEQEKTQDICRGSQCQLRNKRCIAQAQTAVEATPHNSTGGQPTEGEWNIQIESNCISNSTGENCRLLSWEQTTEGGQIKQIYSVINHSTWGEYTANWSQQVDSAI